MQEAGLWWHMWLGGYTPDHWGWVGTRLTLAKCTAIAKPNPKEISTFTPFLLQNKTPVQESSNSMTLQLSGPHAVDSQAAGPGPSWAQCLHVLPQGLPSCASPRTTPELLGVLQALSVRSARPPVRAHAGRPPPQPAGPPASVARMWLQVLSPPGHTGPWVCLSCSFVLAPWGPAPSL